MDDRTIQPISEDKSRHDARSEAYSKAIRGIWGGDEPVRCHRRLYWSRIQAPWFNLFLAAFRRPGPIPVFSRLIPEGDLVDDPTVSDTLPEKESSDDNSCRSLELALAAARTASENRGRDIVVLDLREVTPIFDYFVVATGTSRRQLHAMSEEIDHKLEDDLGDKRMGIEGYSDSRWILLDYGTVVIHLFDDETRAYYDIENLWTQAKQVDLTDVIEKPSTE
ncbi:MAG: ribosome silencing factor [Planctomycetaceae bacterium]|nr:ribosome silencing factor [Planctomycetaceae bacterium]MCB9939089.1 ribosome silencing factor [Planctomycetaceae bacterium]